MLKVKNKKMERNTPKAENLSKSDKKSGKIKEKKSAKKLKKAIKDGLIKAPAVESPKVGGSPIKVEKTSPIDKKEKKRLKKLAQKLKKAEEKGVTVTPNSVDQAKDKPAASENLGKVKEENSIVGSSNKPPQNGIKKARPTVALKEKRKQQRMEAAKIKPKIDVKQGQTIFVGNLPCNTKRIQIIKHFAPYGKVVAIRLRTVNGKLIFKHKKRRESGTLNAYVIFSDADSAAKALEANGSDFKGNHLRVTRTEKLETIVDPKRSIFVGNLRHTCTDEKLRGIFSSCGEIDYVRTLHKRDEVVCSGVGYVCFKSPDAVGLALELKGTILDERPINVERYAKSKLGGKAKNDADKNEGKRKSWSNYKKGTSIKKNYKEIKDKSDRHADMGKKKKKSEFRGVKADDGKKKYKKKPSGELKKLAKKIAPRRDE